MEGWHDFFVAQVGACAALVGLLFVAISLNIGEIIKYPWLPARGAQVLVVLAGALLEASLPLIPSRPVWPVAVALIAVGALTWLTSLVLVRAFVRGVRAQKQIEVPGTWTLGYVATAQVATLPALAGGVLVLAGDTRGYYWIAAGVLCTLAFAMYNAWVLLIEILR